MRTNLFNWRQILIMGLVISLFIACKDDKSNSSAGAKADLIGKWTINSSTVDASVNGISVIKFIMDQLMITEQQAQLLAESYVPQMQGTIEFNSDGTYESVIDGEEDDGTWSLSQDGKKLTLDANTMYEIVMDVITLTSKNLVVSYSETQNDEDLDGDDKNDELSFKIQLNLTK